jgi:hypothetical protein
VRAVVEFEGGGQRTARPTKDIVLFPLSGEENMEGRARASLRNQEDFFTEGNEGDKDSY